MQLDRQRRTLFGKRREVELGKDVVRHVPAVGETIGQQWRAEIDRARHAVTAGGCGGRMPPRVDALAKHHGERPVHVGHVSAGGRRAEMGNDRRHCARLRGRDRSLDRHRTDAAARQRIEQDLIDVPPCLLAVADCGLQQMGAGGQPDTIGRSPARDKRQRPEIERRCGGPLDDHALGLSVDGDQVGVAHRRDGGWQRREMDTGQPDLGDADGIHQGDGRVVVRGGPLVEGVEGQSDL